jgi:hypothetical protein
MRNIRRSVTRSLYGFNPNSLISSRQVAEFIEFEDRLDNSLQRDLIKLDHVRMRFVLEPPTAETAPLELQELDFVLYKKGDAFLLLSRTKTLPLTEGRIDHHDNRDFDLVPDYSPLDQSKDLKTAMAMGPQPGVRLPLCQLIRPDVDRSPTTQLKWFKGFVKSYMRALNRHIDPSFHSDDLESTSEEDLSEVCSVLLSLSFLSTLGGCTDDSARTGLYSIYPYPC